MSDNLNDPCNNIVHGAKGKKQEKELDEVFDNFKKFKEDLEAASKVLKEIADVQRNGKRGNGSGGGGGHGDTNEDGFFDESGVITAGKRRMNTAFDAMQRMLSGALTQLAGGFDPIKMATKGIIQDEMAFTKNIRAAAFETQGVTAASRGLQKEWENIGETAYLTGQDRTTFQQNYVSNIRKGIKDQKVALNLTKSQLYTETMLGAEAGSLSDEFVMWNRAFKMDNAQIADVGRGMQQIARDTGLTGQNLVNVVKSSGNFMKQMRNAGTLTAEAVKNTIELQANAEKFGVTESMGPIQAALSSASNLFLKATPQVKNLLFASAQAGGVMKELTSGTIKNSKQGMAKLTGGMKQMFERVAGFSVDKMKDMSDEAKANASIRTQSAYGMDVGEMAAQIKAQEESAKTLGQKLQDINKERQQNLTLEEKAALMEKERNLKTTETLSVMTALDEAAKGAKDMNEALANFGKKKKDFSADLQSMGIDWTSNIDVARKALEQSISGINEGLKKAGKDEMKISAGEIEKALKDPASFRELSKKINEGNEQLGISQKTNLDPVSQIEQGTKQINDTLRQYSSSALKLLDGVNMGIIAMGIILAKIATEVGSLVMLGGGRKIAGGYLESWKEIGGGIKDVFNKLFGKNMKQETKNVLMDKKNILTEKKLVGGGGAPGASEESLGETLSGKGIGALAEKLKAGLGNWRQIGTTLVKGAIALAALTAGLLITAAAIYYLAKGIMGITGVNGTEMAKVALQVAEIIGATALIAVAVLAAAGGLWLIGLAFGQPWFWPALGVMAIGAVILAVLAPIITALGIAIVGLCGWLMSVTGVDGAAAAKTAQQLGEILWSAAEIAGSVLLAAGALTLLAPFALIAWLMVPIMTLGAAALMALAVPVMALTGAIIEMSKAFVQAIDPKKASDAAAGMASIMESGGKIAGSILDQVKYLTLLSPLVLIAPFVVWAMMLGAIAFFALAEPALLFTAAIIEMSKGFIAMVNPRKAARAAEQMATVMEAGGKIADSILGQVKYLSLLAPLALIAPFLVWAMTIGAGVFMTLAIPSLLFIASVIALGRVMGGMLGKGEGKKIARSIEIISDIVDKVSTALDDLSKKIIPLTEGTGFLGLGASPMEKMSSVTDQVAAWMPTIIGKDGFVQRAILDPMKDAQNVGEIREAAQKMRAISSILGTIGPLFKRLGTAMNAMTRAMNGGGFAGMVMSFFGMGSGTTGDANGMFVALTNLTKFLASLPDQTELSEQVQRLQIFADSMDAIYQAMSGMAGPLNKIAGLNIDFGGLNKINALNAAISPKNVAQTAGVDVNANVQQQVAGSSPSTTQVSSPDLSQMSSLQKEEIHQQSETNQLLRQIITLLQSPNSGGSESPTATRKKPSKPPKTGKWTTGQFSQTPGQSVVNMGSFS